MNSRNGPIRSPFKFLDPYQREDGVIFFGRAEEVEGLYESVNKNRLVLLYGQSGTGKTSVVQCGLANRFEITDWLPFFIRRGKDINESLRQALSQSRALGGMQVTPGKLLDALARISARYVRPVYLIFDQFEELLILGGQAEQTEFLATIRDILGSEKARPCHLLFILREEYFAGLDIFERAIPGFSDRRLRIEPMRPARLEEVILQSCERFGIKLEKGVENARQMIGSLRSKGGIALPYLQVYLDMLWREDYARTYPQGWEGEGPAPLEFTTEEIGALGAIEDVLERFLAERTAAIQEELSIRFPALPPDAVRSALDDFVTEEGTKRPLSYRREGKLLQLLGSAPPFLKQFRPEALAACLDSLEQSRLLRADEDSYELAHDSLAALIDRKRTEEQRHLNELRRQIRSSYRVYRQTGDYLTGRQLAAYADDIPLLGLDDELLQFVEESRRHREEEANRQLREARATAEKERRLREEAQQNERRARRRTRLAMIVSIVAIALAALAGFFYVQSNRETERANDNAKQAEANAREATANAREAGKNLQLAEENAQMAKDSANAAEAARRAAEANLALAVKNEKQAKTNLGRALIGEGQAKENAAAAEQARQAAEANLKLAERREAEAKSAQADAERALRELKAANARLAVKQLEEIDQHILALQYGPAEEKYLTAQRLAPDHPGLARPYQEIAFVYTESGNYEAAKKWLAASVENPAGLELDGPDIRQRLLDVVRNLSAEGFAQLQSRYYPEMTPVEGGLFSMGSNQYEDEEKPVHSVQVSSFQMARMEITLWQYNLFALATGKRVVPPRWGFRGNHPVVNVNWYEAVKYCNWLSKQKGLSPVYTLGPDDGYGNPSSVAADFNASGYRLPTEAEWEYAARGGPRQEDYEYSGSDSIGLVAWYDLNSGRGDGSHTQPAGRLQPNGLGLYDMSGNVAEWCWDWYDKGYYRQCLRKGTVAEPRGAEKGVQRILRGGSWALFRTYSAVAFRSKDAPSASGEHYGFRTALTRSASH